jgi:hypothetical protein
MKYIRTYEKLRDIPEIGDYVCCHLLEGEPEEQIYTNNFLNNNIGKLINIRGSGESQKYEVKFKNKFEHESQFSELYGSFIMGDIEKNIACFFDDEFDFFSKNKEDVETHLSAKKYNL